MELGVGSSTGQATEGAARSTVLEVTQAEASHRFVAWQALVGGHVCKSSSDPAVAPQPFLATPKRCKDEKELKEKLTALSLMDAEYEKRFQEIDEAQKMFDVKDMMRNTSDGSS